MEDYKPNILDFYQPKFLHCVNVERLFPFLEAGDAVTQGEIAEILTPSATSERVERLLNVLLPKGPQALDTLLLTLEATYPHVLASLFLGRLGRAHGDASKQIGPIKPVRDNGAMKGGGRLRPIPGQPPPPPMPSPLSDPPLMPLLPTSAFTETKKTGEFDFFFCTELPYYTQCYRLKMCYFFMAGDLRYRFSSLVAHSLPYWDIIKLFYNKRWCVK